MTLEQLNTHLQGTLEERSLTALNELQQKTIARLKQGGNAVITGESGSGKTTAVALASLIKAPDSYEGSPRVIILSSTVDKAHQLHAQLTEWVRRTEISVELTHDKGNMVRDRNTIFDGVDILVGNPKRILDLYIQNGIHMNQLVLFVIDDADEIAKDTLAVQHIVRLSESLPKCQRFIFAKEQTPKMERLQEAVCPHFAHLAF